MSDFEDDSTFQQHSSSKAKNTTAKTSPKGVRFGVPELVIFISLWIIVFFAFRFYTRSNKKKSKGWFDANEEKKAYEKALEEGVENDEALKKLLMRRCMTDVRRLVQIQEERDSITSLSRAGAISEEMLAEFKAAERELELELFEVQAEAETFREGWGAEIVQDAARLSKIEDDLLAVKRKKDLEKERKEKEETKAEPISELDAKEKQKLLEELLDEDDRTISSSASGKSKKRGKK